MPRFNAFTRRQQNTGRASGVIREALTLIIRVVTMSGRSRTVDVLPNNDKSGEDIVDYSLSFWSLLSHWSKDAPGYIASGFVLVTFCMTSMRWLRMVAIASNVAFIYYALEAYLYPVLVLHSVLLPINITRLAQIQIARISGKRLLAQATSLVSAKEAVAPVFINSQALADPSTALNLAEREQQRVACMLSFHMIQPNESAPGSTAVDVTATLLLDEIDRFLAGLATAGGLSAMQAEHLTALRSRDEVLRALHEALSELAVRLADVTRLPEWIVVSMREGLGAILLIAEDAARSSGPEEIAVLEQLTSDRSALVEQLRSRAVSRGDTGDQSAVYSVTALYERSVWLLRRYAQLLKKFVADSAVSTHQH